MFRSVEVQCTDVLNCQLRGVAPSPGCSPPLPSPPRPRVPCALLRLPVTGGTGVRRRVLQSTNPGPPAAPVCPAGEFMQRNPCCCLGASASASAPPRSQGTRRDSRAVTPEAAGGGGEAAGPQMMVGTLPPLLPRLLFFLDRLGVAMSTKRSSGQPYCSRTSMHSWLEACRA